MSAINNAGSIDLGNYPDHALIREAEGLTVEEKVLLFTVASHKGGKSYATVDTIRQWTGLSRNKYYAARRSLLDKGLLSEERSRGGATTYRLRKQALQAVARLGISRRKMARAQRTFATSAPPEPLPAMGTTPASPGHGREAQVGQATPRHDGHRKTNDQSNNEDIKNMRPSRRVRPPRHKGQHAPAGGDTMEAKKARLRKRLNEGKVSA